LFHWHTGIVVLLAGLIGVVALARYFRRNTSGDATLSVAHRVDRPTQMEDQEETYDCSVHARGSLGSARSIGSIGSFWSIGSIGSSFSVGSIGSSFSIGSIGSFASIGSLGSLLSVGSVFSIAGFFTSLSARTAVTKEL
jgi:hypothetical protein